MDERESIKLLFISKNRLLSGIQAIERLEAVFLELGCLVLSGKFQGSQGERRF